MLKFKVQGSAAAPYTVTFVSRSNNNLSAYCTCPTGSIGQACKHRLNILNGLTKGIVSNNLEDVETVLSWLPGTDIENAMIILKKLEPEVAKLKRALSVAKKELSRAMRD